MYELLETQHEIYDKPKRFTGKGRFNPLTARKGFNTRNHVV